MAYKVVSKEEYDRNVTNFDHYDDFATGGGYDFKVGLIQVDSENIVLYWFSVVDNDYHRWVYERNAAFEKWATEERVGTPEILKPTSELTAYAAWDLFCYVFDYEIEAKVKLT